MTPSILPSSLWLSNRIQQEGLLLNANPRHTSRIINSLTSGRQRSQMGDDYITTTTSSNSNLLISSIINGLNNTLPDVIKESSPPLVTTESSLLTYFNSTTSATTITISPLDNLYKEPSSIEHNKQSFINHSIHHHTIPVSTYTPDKVSPPVRLINRCSGGPVFVRNDRVKAIVRRKKRKRDRRKKGPPTTTDSSAIQEDQPYDERRSKRSHDKDFGKQ